MKGNIQFHNQSNVSDDKDIRLQLFSKYLDSHAHTFKELNKVLRDFILKKGLFDEHIDNNNKPNHK